MRNRRYPSRLRTDGRFDRHLRRRHEQIQQRYELGVFGALAVSCLPWLMLIAQWSTQ